MLGSIDSIETFGLVDGPGIRTVIFMNGCRLRCKYCHNPEMWELKHANISVEELVEKVKRNRPYFKRNHGGVTFSGGEPLLQVDFLIAACKALKNEGIHVALDTAGFGIGKYEEVLNYVDLVLLDIKHVTEEEHQELTGLRIMEREPFLEVLKKAGTEVWIRQVIVPNLMDNEEYLQKLNETIKGLENITKITFLPYHKLGKEKYEKLNIAYPYERLEEMDKERCQKLEDHFINDIFRK